MSSPSIVAKLKKLSGIHFVIFGLLAIHTLWIFTHLNLVSRDLINPWKLGGYGMYTKPANRARLRIFDVSTKTAEQIPRMTFRANDFYEANLRYIFRCRPMSKKSFLLFMRKNPHLTNINLRFEIREREFQRQPIRAKWVTHSVAEITWLDDTKFSYTGKVCDTQYSGEAEFKS